jgi:ribosomal protein L11 methyltransferase
MNRIWAEMGFQVPSEGVDLVCYELMGLGCEGVTVEERQLNTFTPPDPDEASPPNYFIKAYFPLAEDLESLRCSVKKQMVWLSNIIPGLVPVLPEVCPVRNEDWAEGWKQHFSAIRFGRQLIIKPSWESFLASEGEAVITIDPGMAFGTGTHATTQLCLEALATLFDRQPRSERVLDVGTGSGILAIAAAVLGAKRVLACDIEEEACRTAWDNARLNGVMDRLEVTKKPLESLEGGFQLVLANIMAEENIRLASELVERLASGGTLILSGILLEKEQLVIKAFKSFELSDPAISHMEEWTCLLYRKKS